MPSITYIQPDGVEKTVEVPVGRSVKDGAISHMVQGIIAECGGACSCATCHVHVDEHWLAQTGGAEDDEAEMLEFALDVDEYSRLGCQIIVTEQLDGLIVHVAKEQ